MFLSSPAIRPENGWMPEHLPNATFVGLGLAITAWLHDSSFGFHPVWPGVVEHIYVIPIPWAAWRGDLIGGSLAGLFAVFAVWWISLERPTDAEQIARLKSELRDRNELLARSGKLTAADELAVGLAHEPRHPVASIRGISTLFKDPAIKPGVREECAAIVDQECDRLGKMLREMLGFVRPATPQFASIRPRDAIDGALALVKLAAPSANVKFRTEIDANLVSLTGDPELMRHALMKLLLNAVQAMPARGVVTVRATRASGTVRIEVIDDGRGIAPELADKVLLPFVTTRPDGIGRGLAIAKQIAMQHAGQLEAEPNLGRGITFRLTLPHSEEEL